VNPPSDYPQEYLDGKVEFFYLDFFVDENVLIPRLETESLVRRVLQETKETTPDILVDIGTGSGIIPVSIGKNITLENIY
jgi:release factor glutamine methyltransferase